MPVHSHNINTTVDFEDPGHTHNLKVNTDAVGGGFPAFESSVAEGNFSTQTSTTGITLNVTCTAANSGGNQAHSNIQPSHAAYYIMYIP